MVLGRVVRCLAQLTLLGLRDIPVAFGAFFANVIVVAIPGVILQLVLIPSVLQLLKHSGGF